MSETKQKRKYKTKVRKTPKVGTIEWELWRLEEGETYTITRMMRVDEATNDKLRKLKNSAKALLANTFKRLRYEHGKDFTLSAYDLYDNHKKIFVVFAVATALGSDKATEIAKLDKLDKLDKGVNDDFDL